jgi:anti-sigma B factor antagonist
MVRRERTPAVKKDSRMAFDCCVINDVHVLTPRKNLVGGDETTSLEVAVAELAAKGIPRVVVDVGRIEWVSSLGIEGLLKARRTCLDRRGWFRLARVGQRIENILLITKLVLVFETFETVEKAIVG